MKQLLRFALTATLVAGISACSKSTSTTDPPVVVNGDSTALTATTITTNDEPDVNSATVESVWSGATAMTINVSKIGQNFQGADRHFPVTIKSLVSDQKIFFLVQYADPTESYLRTPLAFTGGDASNRKNWARIPTYDDGVSFVFEQDAGTSDLGNLSFHANGCTMLCHSDNSLGKAGMFPEDSGRYDLWYWHSGKSNADGYAEDNICEGKPILAMIKDDANTDDFLNNTLVLDSGYLPFKVAGGNNRQLDLSRYLAAETAQNFDASKPNPTTGAAWSVGDRVPAYMIGNPTPGNDYYDVAARGYYNNGIWTVKFERDLTPQSAHLDVAFKSGSTYHFSFAVHDATPPDNHYGVANQEFRLKLP